MLLTAYKRSLINETWKILRLNRHECSSICTETYHSPGGLLKTKQMCILQDEMNSLKENLWCSKLPFKNKNIGEFGAQIEVILTRRKRRQRRTEWLRVLSCLLKENDIIKTTMNKPSKVFSCSYLLLWWRRAFILHNGEIYFLSYWRAQGKQSPPWLQILTHV